MKKKICEENPVVGYYADSAFTGIEIHFIEYGSDDYVYFARVLPGKTTYHKSKIRYDIMADQDYFTMGRTKYYFSDFQRV